MALNIQTLPWADEALRTRVGARVRMPAVALILLSDFAAVSVPVLLAPSLHWRGVALAGLILGWVGLALQVLLIVGIILLVVAVAQQGQVTPGPPGG